MIGRGKSAGFTLTEIMISLVLFLLVSLFSYQIFKADNKVFVEQEEVVDMQQNARVAMDQLLRDLRVAGAGVPIGGTGSDLGQIYPVMQGYCSGGPDTVKILASFENVRTEMNVSMSWAGNAVKVEDASQFEAGDLAIISGRTQDCDESAEIFQITEVDVEGQHRLKHEFSPPWNGDRQLSCTYIIPSTISLVSFYRYYIDYSDSLHPSLMRVENEGDPQVLADNIENVEIVYDLVTGDKDIPDPDDPSSIRKATITLVARTNTPDPQWNGGIHSISGMNDNYRRIVLKSDIQIRNLDR